MGIGVWWLRYWPTSRSQALIRGYLASRRCEAIWLDIRRSTEYDRCGHRIIKREETMNARNELSGSESPEIIKLGLALSGGGLRASFFHIGLLAQLAMQ